MRNMLKGAIAAIVLTGCSLAVVAPADARYHHGNGKNALVAGIVGLSVGAAIASADRGHYGGSGGYYSYDVGPSYYAPTPVAYYAGGYDYDRPYYGGYSYDRRYDGRGQRDWGRRGHDRYDHGNHHRGYRDHRR